MFKFVILSTLVVLACGQQPQYKDPRTAAIISEQRYLSGDGQFGAAYTQEDGTDFKEETDADGTRHGSYSYIDPNGQKRTISYTAGKDGFRASGDHLPVAPAGPPQAAAPQPRYDAQPQYHQAPQQPQYHAQPAPVAGPSPRLNTGAEDYDDGQYDPRYNDPSFQGPSSVGPARVAAPAAPQQQNYYEHQFQAPAQQQYQQPAAPQYQPQPQQYQQQAQPQYHQQAAPVAPPQYYTTTPAPHRFQPPGKLALSRTPDGFSYSFNKV